MGVTLDLRLIDHVRVTSKDAPAVNRAVLENDARILLDYIVAIPFTPDPDTIAYRQERLKKLQDLHAPAVIIENEVTLLKNAKGEGYTSDILRSKTLDELRVILGQWGRYQDTYRLETWYGLDWFLQPAEGPDDLLTIPIRPKAGDPMQTLLDQALKGSELSPVDCEGMPLIRTCGSKDEDCFGYNPPEKVAVIHDRLSAVDVQKWDDLVPQRIELHQRNWRYSSEQLNKHVEHELAYAREGFEVLLKAYGDARDREFGVACEYNL